MKIEMCENTATAIGYVVFWIFLTIAIVSIASCAGRVHGPQPEQSPTRSADQPVAGRNVEQSL